MLKDLVKLADHLDRKGLSKEADFLDSIIKKSSENMSEYFDGNKVLDEHGKPMFELPEVEDNMADRRKLDDVLDMVREMGPELQEELIRQMVRGGPLPMGSA